MRAEAVGASDWGKNHFSCHNQMLPEHYNISWVSVARKISDTAGVSVNTGETGALEHQKLLKILTPHEYKKTPKYFDNPESNVLTSAKYQMPPEHHMFPKYRLSPENQISQKTRCRKNILPTQNIKCAVTIAVPKIRCALPSDSPKINFLWRIGFTRNFLTT